MRGINWQRPSRQFNDGEVDDFYNRALDVPHLFRFTTSRTELPEHGGSLSLKIVLSGEEEYRIGNRVTRLRPGQLLVINSGQHYSSRIRQPTESLSVFIPERDRFSLGEAALSTGGNLCGNDGLYDRIDGFPQVAFRVDQSSKCALHNLISALDLHGERYQREAAQRLMIEAVRNLHSAIPFSNLKSTYKASTRQELAQRLARAKERIDDTFGRTNDLAELASTACLSKYYFLRLFTEMFGTSPGAYARRTRLIHAVREIRNGEDPRSAARKAGYRDFRAFRRACLRTKGLDTVQISQYQTTSS